MKYDDDWLNQKVKYVLNDVLLFLLAKSHKHFVQQIEGQLISIRQHLRLDSREFQP